MVWGASRVVPLWGAGTGAGFPRVMEARTRVTSAIEGDSMPDPSDYEVAFQIISTAGNAKSDSMIAIREARAGDFTAAQEALERADTSLHEAHRAQTKLLTAEARGNEVKLNIILVHAQDHLMGSILLRDLAEEFIEIHKVLHEKKED